MQSGFASATYPLLSNGNGNGQAFNPQSLIASSTSAVLKADAPHPHASPTEGSPVVPGGKKRARPSHTAAAADSPEGEGDDEETKARKRRLALSCGECKRRKIKCDRKQPCSSCIRRKCPDSCNWDDDPDQAQSFALNSDVRHLARRLAHLESLVLTPKDSVQPSPNSAHAFDSPASPHRRNNNNLDESMRDDDEAGRSETEDAAHLLEDVAFGARVPVLRAISTAAHSANGGNSSAAGRRPARVGSELTAALTSIIAEPLSFDQDGRPRSAVRLGLDLAISTHDLPTVRSGSMAQIFAVLPGKEIADFLLRKYFAEMDWDFQPLDSEAFFQEHERYREMLMDGREVSIDPLWVAVFCMVLALSLEGFWSRPGGAKNLNIFGGLTERELQDLPSVWHDAALRALQLGEWGGTPRIRTIQTIILFGQYIQIASSSGQQGRFLGWAASAIRVAQRMGLHRLGMKPEIMPPDDPALPPGKNSLKRELSVRIFNMLVVIDSLLSDANHRCYLLHPSQYNTARPSNLNYSDLSRTEWRTINPSPLNVHTDASFEIAQCNIAAQVRRALDVLVLGTLPFSYNRVLDQDREFKQVFESLPDVFSERCPPVDSLRLRYQRALLHEGIYARLIRLHRPFLSRGYNPGSQFRFSMEQCVRAARLVIASNYDVLRITSSLWWIYMSTLGSAIVIFMDLFQCIDTDGPDVAINEKKEVLVKAATVFNTHVVSPALRAVVEQGRRILSGLFLAEENRRMTRAAHTLVSSGHPPDVESFSQVVQRISQEVSNEDHSLLAPPQPPPTTTSTFVAPGPDLSAFEYWGEGGLGTAQPSQDFTSFFETLASEDWTAAFGNGNGSDSGAPESALLGQMAATW